MNKNNLIFNTIIDTMIGIKKYAKSYRKEKNKNE